MRAPNIRVDSQYLLALCGPILRFFLENVGDASFQLKGDEQPVTQLDLKIDRFLFEHLTRDDFTEAEIISEERAMVAGDSSRHWIIDPLDGTKEFIRGIPEFAVSIAYREQNKFQAALVYNPANGFSSASDATGLAPPINPAFTLPDWDNNVILCSRTEWERGLFARQKFSTKVVPVGSIAYKMALVAQGFALGTLSLEPKNSWDIAAGTALIEAGGGKVTDLEGNALDFSNPRARFRDGILASKNSAFHEKLLREIRL